MTIQRAFGLSVLVTAITLSGCSSLKGNSQPQSPDSGTTPSSERTDSDGVDTSKAIVLDAADGSANASSSKSALTKAAKAGFGAEQSVVHFAYDSDALSGDDISILKLHAAFLKSNTDVNARLEGHTDERGTTEYNVALGERRAKSVRYFLQSEGVKARQLEVVSYGELKPVVRGDDEESWAKNRRTEIIYR